MYDHTSYLAQQALLCHQGDEMRQALRLFNHAMRSGFRGLLDRLLAKRAALLDLNAILRGQGMGNSHFSGVRVIPLDRIQGSEGRCRDFDGKFHPLNGHNRERWTRIAMAMLRDEPLPPVDLIEVEGVYFVRDGHHRISVAGALGRQSIDAVVTTWELSGAGRLRLV